MSLILTADFSTLSHISSWHQYRSPESDELSLKQMQFWDRHAPDEEGGSYYCIYVDCIFLALDNGFDLFSNNFCILSSAATVKSGVK